MNELESIDWKGGIVIYNDFPVDSKLSPEQQTSLLKEDLIQIQFSKNILIDVGWYPEFSPEGNFVVTLIENSDWGKPLKQLTATKFGELLNHLQKCISIASMRQQGEH